MMIVDEVATMVDGYAAAARQVLAADLAAVYLVGGLALGDFSPRQSNVDLVVVTEAPISSDRRSTLGRAEKALRRVGRAAEVWYTTWNDIADGPPDHGGADPVSTPTLETPLTRALLRQDAVAVLGPDWPVVQFDSAAYRSWCVQRLKGVAARAEGSMLMRTEVSLVVLEAARLTQGAVTGRVFSKTEAGDTVGPLVPSHFRRILTDALGWRAGAKTSMYWGPFERKYDAKALLGHLLDVAAQPH